MRDLPQRVRCVPVSCECQQVCDHVDFADQAGDVEPPHHVGVGCDDFDEFITIEGDNGQCCALEGGAFDLAERTLLGSALV